MATGTIFRVESLADLDGGYTASLVNRHLAEAVADCFDRPGDESSRTVTLRLHIKPVARGPVCEGVAVEAEVGPLKRPSIKCPPVGMRVETGNRLVFNPLAPDAPDQLTLDQGRD